MKQVAERAGVSQVTVTNVLRGRHGKTSPATRERVLRSVRELGYVPVAQPSFQGRHVETNIIGVVFDQLDIVGSTGSTGSLLYEGLREGALKHGYDLLMLLRSKPDWAPDREEVQYLDRRSDGFIFIAPLRRQKVLSALVEHEIPVVACGSIDVPAGVARVVSDNADEMRQAVAHLREHGHERIIHIAGPKWNSDERQRAEAFSPAMREAGLHEFADAIVGLDDDWMSYEDALRAIQDLRATAVICCSDGYALNLWKVAQRHGLVVPRDLSIVGINDTPGSGEAGLTSVNLDLPSLGLAAIESWFRLRQGASAEEASQTLPVRLVSRNSVATLSV